MMRYANRNVSFKSDVAKLHTKVLFLGSTKGSDGRVLVEMLDVVS